MPNGTEFKAPTPELQEEFNRGLERELVRVRKYYQELTPGQKATGEPRYSLDWLEMVAKQSLIETYSGIAAAEELRLDIEAGEFRGLPPAVATSYLTWKEQEADLLRRRRLVETAIRDAERLMEDVGAPTILTKAAQFFYRTFGPLFGMEDPRAAGVYEETLARHNTYIDKLEELAAEMVRVKTYQSLYEGLAAYIQAGKVSSYDDLFTLTNEAGEPITRFEEMGRDDETLREIYNQISAAVLGLPEGTSAKELDYDEMIAQMGEKPVGLPPSTITRLTVDAIIASITMGKPMPEFPAGYPTIEAVLKGYEEAGVPDEVVAELEELESYTRELEGYWEALSANQAMVSQGLEEAKMPEMGIGALLLQTVAQPALTALDIFGKLYSEWIAPWGGFLFRLKAHGALDETNRFPATKAEKDFMRIYNEARLTDDWWHAGGKAFAEAELGFLNRFLFEWVADPLTWLGGGLGKALTTGAKVGKFGRFIGPTVNIFEKAWLKSWDVLIFDRIKNAGRFISKTPFQESQAFAGRDMIAVAGYLVRRAGGTYYSKIPMGRAIPWLKEARSWAIHHPEDMGDMAKAGRALLRQNALDEASVLEIGRRLGTELEITKEMILNINSIVNGQMLNRAGTVLTRKTTPAFLLRTLGIPESKKALRMARKEINRMFQRGIRHSDTLLDKATHVPDMLTRVFNNNHGIYLDVLEAAAAHNLAMSGRVASLLSNVDWKVMNAWRTTFDRWVVTPGARMYLAFSAYGPGNIIEGIIKQTMARQIPLNPLSLLRRGRPVTVVNPTVRGQRLMAGLSKPTELEMAVARIEMAGETPSFLGLTDMSVGGRRRLSRWRSLLSGGPIGRFFIDFPGRLGVHQRWDYYRKMFTSFLGDEEATAIMSVLAKNIDDAVKTLPDDTLRALNLTKHELKSELLDRAIAGPQAARNLLDDIIADRLLLAEDAAKREARRAGKKIGERAVSADQALADRIAGGRIGEVAGKYPLVPQPLTDDLIQAASDGSLWARGGRAIDDKMQDYTAAMYDYFVHTPEFYKEKFAQRVQDVMAMEARNKEEFIGMLQELQDIQKFYGESVDDVIRAMNELEQTMRKQMKHYEWAEWRGQYTAEVYEGLGAYGDVAQDGFDKVVGRLRMVMEEPEKLAKVDWSRVTFGWNIRKEPEIQRRIMGAVDNLPIEIKFEIRSIGINAQRIEGLGPEVRAAWFPADRSIIFRSVDDVTPQTLYHEIFHDMVHAQHSGDVPFWSEAARAIGWDDVADEMIKKGSVTDIELFREHPITGRVLGDEVADKFAQYASGEFVNVKWYKFFNEFYPKTQRAVAMTVDEQVSISKLFSAWTDEQRFLRDFWKKRRVEELEMLANKPKGREAVARFWDDFFGAQQAAHEWRRVHQAPFRQAAIQQEFLTSEALGTLGFYPPTVDASGRTLSKMDVATLFRSHPHQIGNSVLRVETMTLKPKYQFVDEVKVQAEIMARRAGRTAEAMGFTDEAIGEVYDYVLRDMYMSPEAVSVLEPHLMELKCLQDEVWAIYNTKGVPRGIADDLQRWLDDLGDIQDKVPGYLTDDFQQAKQRAADKASKEYYKDWADYTNENASTALMRTIYPFWTYELHRFFWLPRATIRTPGLFKAWGSYMDLTEDGYIHIPGTSLEINPLRGTIFMGGMVRLIRRDYPEYYDRFPGLSEFFDFYSRFGFYPAAYLNFLKIFGGKTALGRTNWGELLPAWIKTPLNAYVALFPDSAPAKLLLDTILPEPFRDYTTILVANAICQQERKMFNGMDIADKIAENLELTEEEKDVWTRAVQGHGWMGMIMEQAGVLRIRTEEQLAAWEASGRLIQEKTGYTLEDQLWIRRHGFRVGDYAMLDPLDQDVLGEMDAMKYHSGVFNTLMPSTWQEEDRRRREFFDEVRTYSEARRADQEELDGRVRLPVGAEGRITMGQWARERSMLRERNANFFTDLSETERYYNVAITMEDTIRPDGTVREGMITRAKNRNMLPPVEHPAKEILNLYYSIELEKKVDPETGILIDDWDGYFQKVDAIINALKGAERDDLVDMITSTMTDLERLRWEISRRYFRGYNRRQEAIIATQFSEEEQTIIKQWIFGTPAERDLAREVTHEGTGRKLISYYQSLVRQTGQNLRMLSPELDAWLQFFEITDTTLTDEAARLYIQYRKDWGIAE